MYIIDAFPGRTFSYKGQEYFYFGGTAYLGLQTNKTFQELFKKSICKYGTNYGASRIANVRFSVYEEAEKLLADFITTKSCFTLSSGFLSCQLIYNYFTAKKYHCVFAPNTHVAFHGYNTKNHLTYTNVIADINTALGQQKQVVLFLDTIDFSGKNYPDYRWLKDVSLENVILVADDSHGIGVVESGEIHNTLQAFNPKEIIICGSLGKGFGIQAGVVAGAESIINKLKESKMFAASSPATPAAMQTFVYAQSLYKLQQEKLQENISVFLKELNKADLFTYMKNYPAFSFNNQELTTYLEKNKVVITNFNYPNDTEKTVQRIVISAHHNPNDCKMLAQLINRFFY